MVATKPVKHMYKYYFNDEDNGSSTTRNYYQIFIMTDTWKQLP